jgi:hypothetical protein
MTRTIVSFLFLIGAISTAPVDAIGQNDALGNAEKLLEQAQKILDTFLEKYKGLAEKEDKFGKYLDSLPTLGKNECRPDFGTSSQSMIPSSCSFETQIGGKPGDKCSCFDVATAKLDAARRALARLNCIYRNTKDFKDASIALGDGVSGTAGNIVPLVWSQERAKIGKSFKEFEKAVDTKHREVMNSVQGALTAIGKCEENLGERDWYRRFGFLYYQFLDATK